MSVRQAAGNEGGGVSWFSKTGITGKSTGTAMETRRVHLVDLKLQMPLIVAIVLLEVVILAGAVFYLYSQFHHIFETSAYSIDPDVGRSLVSMFLKELGTVILTMSISNTLLLLVIYKLWLIRIRRTLWRLKTRLQRIQLLNLRPIADGLDESSHTVLGLLDTWRLQELERQQRIGRLLDQLPESADQLTPETRREIVRQLQNCRALL